jgi:c-di-GMP-binding flagellar brake protein YcgR
MRQKMDSTSKVGPIFIFMNTEREERRKCERIVFSDKDGIIGIFSLLDNHKTFITASIMDLGEEGMCLALKQDDENKLHERDHVILKEIKGSEDLQVITNVEMEVKWTLNLKHIAAGCEFVDISQTLRDQIRQFINSWGK